MKYETMLKYEILTRLSRNKTGEPMGVSPRTVRELTLLGSPKDARTSRM
jgi:hypothetical protein